MLLGRIHLLRGQSILQNVLTHLISLMKLAATVEDIYKMAFSKQSLNWQKAQLPLGGYS
uniref:Uncharacterized protein n=1 Tax=Arundo donax TaxID=35708 RepID=A0A0A9G1Y4_ARUDO